MQKKIKNVLFIVFSVLSVLMLSLGLINIKTPTTTNADSSIEEKRAEYIRYLCGGYNVTAGKELSTESINFSNTILDYNNPDLISRVVLRADGNALGAGSYGKSLSDDSALKIAKQIDSNIGVGIEANIAVVNTDINTKFATGSRIENAVKEKYEYYYYYARRGYIDLAWSSLSQLRSWLSEDFKDLLEAVDSEEKAKYLLKNYGTHLLAGYTLGGIMEVTNIISTNSYSEDFSNSTTLEQRLSATAGAYGGSESFSFSESQQSHWDNTKTKTSYEVHFKGGLDEAALTINDLFHYKSAELTGNGHFVYQEWSKRINNNEKLELISISDDAGRRGVVQVWDLLEPTSKNNMARKYLINEYVKMCGNKYKEYLAKYSTNNYNAFEEENEVSGGVSITGFYKIMGDNTQTGNEGYNITSGIVTKVDGDNNTESIVSDNTNIFMRYESPNIILEEGEIMEWRVKAKNTNVNINNIVEVLDVYKGIFYVKPGATESFTVEVYVNNNNERMDYHNFSIATKKYSGGNGTEEDPYILSTPSDLADLQSASGDWNKYFKMACDIDLSATDVNAWFTIGRANAKFTGTFDGNYHAIKNYHRTTIKTPDIGIFGVLDSAGKIKNLKVVNSYFKGENGEPICIDIESDFSDKINAGVLVGKSNGTIENCVIDNCELKIKYMYKDGNQYNGKGAPAFTQEYLYAGMIVGHSTKTITKCGVVNPRVEAKIDSRHFTVFAGNGDVKKWPVITHNISVGGMVGLIDAGCTLQQLYVKSVSSGENKSSVKGHAYGHAWNNGGKEWRNVAAKIFVGGLIGSINKDSTGDTTFKECVIDSPSEIYAGYDKCMHDASYETSPIMMYAGTVIGYPNEKIITCNNVLARSITETNPQKDSETLETAKVLNGSGMSSQKLTEKDGEFEKITDGMTISSGTISARLGSDANWCGDADNFPIISDFAFNNDSLSVYWEEGYEDCYENESFYPEGLSVTLRNAKGTEIECDTYTVDYRNFKENGKITVTCAGKTITVDKNYKNVEVKYFSVSNNVNDTLYEKDIYNPQGRVSIYLIYSDGNDITLNPGDEGYAEIFSKLSFNNGSSITLAVGRNEITVKYKDLTNSYVVTAEEIKVTKITLDTLPQKTLYYVGDKFDPTGMTVTAYLSNKTTREVDYKDLEVYGDSIVEGENKIFVCYADYVTLDDDKPDQRIVVMGKAKYTVTFTDYDDTVISTSDYDANETIVVPQNPIRLPDNTFTYVFNGWDKPVAAVATESVTYKATYTETYIDYTVKFVDYNDAEISSMAYHYGDSVSVPNAPIRPADNTYTYSFANWDKTIMATVTCSITYKATYTSTYINYTVRFVDYNDAVISTKTYHYGDETIIPESPSRASDESYDYEFAGWGQTVSPTVTADVTYKATYTAIEKGELAIIFVNWNNDAISSRVYQRGESIDIPLDPTRASDNTYTYTFNGWDKPVSPTATASVTYKATYTQTYINYTVRFVDYNNTVIDSKTYHYGDTIVGIPEPSRESDETYSYLFEGWDKPVSTCTGNVTFRAVYSQTYMEYTVLFKNYNLTVLSRKTYHYGDTIAVPATPTRPDDDTYTYEFAEWTGLSTICIGDAEYVASFRSIYKEYVVTFKNYDGTVLISTTYHYGDTVVVPSIPTKPEDVTGTYSFSGWDKALETTCSGNVVYTATFTINYKEYTIVFKYDDNTLISSATYHYGDTIIVPSNPVKTADNTYSYTFTGWDKTVKTVATENASYIAQYNATYIDYTVTFKNYNDAVISSATYHYGDTVIVPLDPTRASDSTYTYTFNGWDKPVSPTAMASVTYKATYTQAFIDYTVKFVDYDNTVLSSKTYHYGEAIVNIPHPDRESDETYSYLFEGWNKPVSTCTGNVTFKAVYSKEFVEYTVLFKNYNLTVLSRKTYHYGDTITLPATPTRPDDNTYTYEFAEWTGLSTICTGDAEYVASFRSIYKEYVVTFKNYDNTIITTVNYHYGDRIQDITHPEKPSDSTYNYTFSGWDKTLGTCQGEETFSATFSQELREYLVRFLQDDGTVITSTTYHYGDGIYVPPAPTKSSDLKYDYTFTRWDKEISYTCKGSVDYTAVFDKKQRQVGNGGSSGPSCNKGSASAEGIGGSATLAGFVSFICFAVFVLRKKKNHVE